MDFSHRQSCNSLCSCELGEGYYYHSDHLGSANIITDYEGGVYEHIEYTPYGELWEEQKSDVFDRIPFRFTAKELDTETALYYFGARYLDPRTSRWISSDPAMEGLNWYGYCENNPLRYIDPTGMIIEDVSLNPFQQSEGNKLKLGSSSESIYNVGCVLTAYVRIAMAISGKEISLEKANKTAKKNELFTNENLLTLANGVKLIEALTGKTIGFGRVEGTEAELVEKLEALDASEESYYVTGRIHTENTAGTKKYDHTLSINDSADNYDPHGGYTQPLGDTSRKDRKQTSRTSELFRYDYFYVIDDHNQVK
ncbi:hypothetical protein ES708_19345 [subsurface metagenome]